MKKVLFALAFGAIVSTSVAQELPVPSPSSKLEQRVGLTDVTIEYSRPGVKGRKIFGDLVAYDKVWRFGANKNTMITFSTDVTIDGKNLKAGTYSVFATPSKDNEWVIAFNTDTEQWGAGNYTTSKDALSIKAKPAKHSNQESFTLEINDVHLNGATISMLWEEIEINIPFKVDTDKIAMDNINKAIEEGKDLDMVHYKAARYFKDKKDDKTALEHIEKSLKVKEGFRALYLRAQIHLAAGKKKEAIDDAEKAMKLAQKEEEEGWAKYIQGNVSKWREEK